MINNNTIRMLYMDLVHASISTKIRLDKLQCVDINETFTSIYPLIN